MNPILFCSLTIYYFINQCCYFNAYINYCPKQPLKHMNIILFAFFILKLVQAGNDHLIEIGEKSTCIKEVISSFTSNRDCSTLTDQSKSKLSLQMTQCLLNQMGKSLPKHCQFQHIQSCSLSGDSWNTFSTFYAHIDNLCHFYWQTMHHERAERLIEELSQSSSKAEEILRQNSKQTKSILSLQAKMHFLMNQSLQHQLFMTQLINSSSEKIMNLTNEVQSFVLKIREDLNQNFGSLKNILSLINESVEQILIFQSFMKAEIISIQGMTYFVSLFLSIIFATSFQNFKEVRTKALTLYFANILIQISWSSFFHNFGGTRMLRYLFLVGIALSFLSSKRKEKELDGFMTNYLNTPRLKRVFSNVLMENNAFDLMKKGLSSQKYFLRNEEISEDEQKILAIE